MLAFFSGRLSNQLTSQGASYDVVDAVLSLGIDNITDSANRIEALQQMKKDANFEPLAVSFKRVVNILKSGRPEAGIDPSVFELDAERKLYQKYLEIRDKVRELMAQKMYLDALRLISTIRETVDGFFDGVMVMAEDPAVRQNRLNLLTAIGELILQVGDISKMQ